MLKGSECPCRFLGCGNPSPSVAGPSSRGLPAVPAPRLHTPCWPLRHLPHTQTPGLHVLDARRDDFGFLRLCGGIGLCLQLRQLVRMHHYKTERGERYSPVAVLDPHWPHDALPMSASLKKGKSQDPQLFASAFTEVHELHDQMCRL